ncbi:tetratricopeptide repeat 23-like [Schistosoma japonicum]|uniref:Tetratricopeptide repeat 23-like n=1 Tax=Schistosoma japonicum TaxID=6182 RepID=A0A4Z2CQB7_SCHJA|nr:tetratricopeptide repeat 23-like [Schistosoma japonicum]
MMKKKVNVCKTPDEQLTQNENMINEYAAHRSENDDFIFKMLCECIAYSRILYEVKDWHHAQYQCCLGYFYITFRGENYALQAKSHAENSIKLSSYYLNFTNQQINQQNSDKIKKHFNLIKQTEKSLNKVEQFLNLIQNSQIISQNTLNSNNNKLEQFKRNLENYYQQWNHCTLLRLDRNFFPNLKLLKLQIYYLYGKIAFEYKKYNVSFDQYIKALRLIEEIYGSESKETIAIYHTLGRIEEYRSSANDMNRSLEYFKKAYEISNKIYNEKGSFHSLVDLARSVYQLCTTYMKYNLNLENIEHYLSDILQILNTYNEKNTQNSIEYQIDKKSVESNDHMKEALKLLQENLNLQEDTYGMYNIRVIRTRKLILSINMVQENFIEAVNQAEMCLSLEQFTFGTNSKQVKKTQEILEVLSSYKKSGNGSNSLH